MNKKAKKKVSEEIESLGKRVRALRKKAGYSSYDSFAFDKDISRSQYFTYEKGTDMRFSSIVKIAKANGLTLSEFFAEGFYEID